MPKGEAAIELPKKRTRWGHGMFLRTNLLEVGY